MDLKGWLMIALFATYFIYSSIENARRYKEQKEIAKIENEKTRQAYKNALKEILTEIEKEK